MINRFIFPSTPAAEKSAELEAAKADVVVAGHSGLPFGETVAERYWFNPGVIGMPANDGTTDGWFGIITPEADSSLTFALKRLAYDAESAAASLQTAGVAQPYAEALVTGRWPSTDVLPEKERLSSGRPLRDVEQMLA